MSFEAYTQSLQSQKLVKKDHKQLYSSGWLRTVDIGVESVGRLLIAQSFVFQSSTQVSVDCLLKCSDGQMLVCFTLTI